MQKLKDGAHMRLKINFAGLAEASFLTPLTAHIYSFSFTTHYRIRTYYTVIMTEIVHMCIHVPFLVVHKTSYVYFSTSKI